MLALLTTAMAIAYIDRYVLAMLIQPIKSELGFSDSQIGIVTGFAFSAFYALFGLVIARIADRSGVRLVIISSLFAWSVMTALCGAAQNFLHMLIARFGVGAGEAGLTPASHATLARLFPPERRSMALAILSAAGPAGIMIALFTSGFLEQSVGWRWTFAIMAVPGILLAVLMLITRRLLPEAKTPVFDKSHGAAGAIRLLFRNPAFVSVNLLMALLIFLGLGQAQWIPAYFERSFSVTRTELGPMLAVTQGLGMLVGGVLGGLIADWLMTKKAQWRAYFIVAAMSAAPPFLIAVFLVNKVSTAYLLIGVGIFLAALPTGALWATVQDAAPEEHRATGAAFTMMVGFILGLGIGPFLVGVVSDSLHASHGLDSLRYALVTTASVAALAMLAPLAVLAASARSGVSFPAPAKPISMRDGPPTR